MKYLLEEQLFNEINDLSDVTEIRLRKNRPTLIKTATKTRFLHFVASEEYLKQTASRAVRYSPYAYEDEISAGFIPYAGGVRIGIAGRGNRSGDKKLAFSEVTSLCIRIPHEAIGAADVLPDDFYDDFSSTLLFSPPFCGKTTLIRDMARVLSERFDTLLIDERGELCPQNGAFRMGKRADIIQNIPKKYLYENIIRAMSPEIVVCDELFGQEDVEAMEKFSQSGIVCLASLHARSFETVPDRLKNCFRNFIQLTDIPKVGSVVSVRRNAHGGL